MQNKDKRKTRKFCENTQKTQKDKKMKKKHEGQEYKILPKYKCCYLRDKIREEKPFLRLKTQVHTVKQTTGKLEKEE